MKKKKLLSFILTGTLVFNNVPGIYAVTSTINEEISTEDYAKWKSEFINSNDGGIQPFAVSNNSISNDYLSITVAQDGRFTIGTTGGNPNIDSDNNKKLLYGHPSPGTSFTTIRIDNQDYIFTANSDIINNDESIEISEILNGLEVKQILSLELNPYTQRKDLVNIKYVIKNTSAIEHDIGTRVLLDTMLGNNDGAPFKLSGYGNITKEIEFWGDNVPQHWQAFDNIENPSVVSTGLFYENINEKPDKVQFAYWRDIYDTKWDYTINEGKYVTSDSAVAIYNYPKRIEPNQELVINTYYGLSDFSVQDVTPPLGVRISSPEELSLNENGLGYENNPFAVDAFIWNNSDATATNSKAQIILPKGLSLAENENQVKNLGDITVGSEKEVSWNIIADPQTKDTTLNYTIKITSDNGYEKVLEVPIYLPKTKIDTVYIVLPGVMGSELYSKENGEQYWPYATGVTNMLGAQKNILNLACDKDGKSKKEISPDSINDSTYGNDGEYGAQNVYTKLVKKLQNEFGEDNVVFFPYDWRMSIESAAENLKKFIDENNYSDINIVAHSMGGLVACEYIKMAPEKKDNIKLITMGTPYLGAPTALERTETGNAVPGLLPGAVNLVNGGKVYDAFKKVLPNITGLYELLPTKNYFTYKNESPYYVKQYVKYTNSKLMNFLLTKKDQYKTFKLDSYTETKQNILNSSWGNEYILNNSEDTHNNLEVLDVFNSVPSYAIIGWNEDTPMRVDQYYGYNNKYEKTKVGLKLKGGDATVPIISATIGGKIPEDKDFYIKEEHSKLPKHKDVIDFVCTKFKNWNSTFSSDDLLPDLYETDKKWSWDKFAMVTIKRELSKSEIVPKLLTKSLNNEESISIPNIRVYSPKGELIVEINDENLMGEINDYGSFSISSDEEEIKLYLNVPEDGKYKIEVSGEGTYYIDMVQGQYSTDEEGNLDLDKYLAGNVIETKLFEGKIEDYELKEQNLMTINFGKDGDYSANLDKDSNGDVDEEINIKKALEGVLSDNIEPSIEINVNEKNKNKSIISIKANDNISLDKIAYIIYDPEKEDESTVEPKLIYENTNNKACKEIEIKDIYTFKNKNDGEIMKIAAVDMNGNIIEAEYTHHKKVGNNTNN